MTRGRIARFKNCISLHFVVKTNFFQLNVIYYRIINLYPHRFNLRHGISSINNVHRNKQQYVLTGQDKRPGAQF